MADAAAALARKNARKKVLSRLGMTPKDLWTMAVAPQNGGLMKRSDWRMFWELIDGPSEATWMLGEVAQLINKQLDSWKAGSNTSTASGADPSQAANNPNAAASSSSSSGAGAGGPIALDSLLTTFNFICLTLELQTADKKVKDVLAAWQKIEATQNSSKNLANQHPLFAQTKELYRLLALRCDPRGDDALIGPLILNAISMYGSIREFERMMDVIGYSTIDDSADLKGGENAFHYEYLKRLARDGQAIPNTTTQGKIATTSAVPAAAPPNLTGAAPASQTQLMLILANTVSKIVTLPQQMKMNPKVAETTYCALFHLMRNFLSLHAIVDANFLRAALNTLQPFLLWPQPFGGMARAMITRMQEESLLSGSMLRAKLEAECNTAPYWDTDVSPAAGSGAAVSQSGELTSALFYIYAADDARASSYANIIDLKPFKPAQLRKPPPYVKDADGIPALLTPTLQALTILNLLASDNSTAAGVEADLAAMRQCSGEQVFALYKRAQQLISSIFERPGEGAALKARGLADLRAAIKATAASGAPRGDLVRLAEKLSPPYTMPLPLVSHLALVLPSSSSFHFDPRDQWRMVGYKVAPFAHVALAEHLGNLLNMYRDASRATPLTLRLMLAGGDELLHQVLCAWCALRQTRPEVFEGLRPRFFVLPYARNHLAAFMARHDAWYNRHVYVPSRSNTFMLPWMREEEGGAAGAGVGSSGGGASGALSPGSQAAGAADAAAEETGELPPGVYFRRSLESYAREATLTMESAVWQCEGYVSAESEGLRPDPKAKVPPIMGPDQLTPFFQRVELGVTPAAVEFKRARKLADSVRVEDIVSGSSAAGRGFDFNNPTELVVKFTKMDYQGRLTEVVTEEAAVYHSILLSAVPRRGDPTFPASPTAPCIELAAKLHKSYAGNKQAALLGRKPVLMQDPKQHVVELEVWCANPNHAFGLMLDGQYFGPYYRVKILPAFQPTPAGAAATQTPMTFPLQHFFPMDI